MRSAGRCSALAPACVALALFATPASAFSVSAAFPFGPAHVAVAFDDSVDIASALQPAHYAIAIPGGAAPVIQSVQLQDNQRTVILTVTSALPVSATGSVTVTDVVSRHGAALGGGSPAPFTTPAQALTGIADIHADVNALIGKTVTVIGAVYIRSGSVTGTPSGFIQDGTGRGLNVFGGSLPSPLDTLGTVALVTGTVELYYTTVEITNPVATVIRSRMPPLAPRVLSVSQAASSQWEGTYIRATATLTGAPTASGSNHYNFPATGDGLPFSFRVRTSTGVNPADFVGNEVVTGAGAGSSFSGAYQITVGVPGDFYKGTGPGDLTPPVLVSASGEGGASTVSVTFSEPVAAGASTPSNYTLYPTATPSAPIAVTAAAPAGATVTLTVAEPLTAATSYTLAVSGVRDAAGNEVPPGTSIVFTAATPVSYQVAGVFRFGAEYVGVAFTKKVNASAATTLTRYSFAPALALAGAELQANGQTVILRASGALPASTTYQVTVGDVPSATGEALPAHGPFAFETGAETVTDIATIQDDLGTWSGQTVTVIGQVTIPVGSRGGTPSGYLEDGSGRGVNLFGGSIQGAVNELGSVAKVTGTVELYFTTTEITTYAAVALASGMPHLGARVLSVADANDARWEGTYIETSGTLTAITPSGTSNTNYDATEGGSTITFRVGNALGIPPGQFVVGDRVTGRGAGGSFQSTFQINVGNLQDFALAGGGGPDVTPPRPLSATGNDGSPLVTLTFDEPLRSNEATLTSSWTVTPQGGAAIAVTQAVLAASGRTVTLTLAQSLAGGTRVTVAMTGIADLAGNVVSPGTSIAFTVTQGVPGAARLEVAARTMVRGLPLQGEVFSIEASGPLDSKVTCRVLDLQGRLVRVLFDGRLSGTPRRTLTWDGRDEQFEYVPAGLYVCHLLATDPQGTRSEARVPLVVAVRLQ